MFKLPGEWARDAIADACMAVRSIRQTPVFAFTVLTTLTVGIGANATLFSLLDAVALRALAVREPGRLVTLHENAGETFGYPAFDRVRQGGRVFAGAIASYDLVGPQPIDDRRGGTAARISAVSANYFDVLGIRPRHGATFHAAPETGRAEPLAVISDAYSRLRFGSSGAAVGETLQYLGRTFVITGVMPVEFRGVVADNATDVWLPLEQTMPANDMRWTRGRWLRIMARLQTSATAAQAGAEVSALLGRVVTAENGRTGYSSVRRRFVRPLVILQVVVAVVLLIGCANIAGLTLTRCAFRAREFAIRHAIGAARSRLGRQLLIESLSLCCIGGAFGLVNAWWLSSALLALLPAKDSGAATAMAFQMNPSVLGFWILLIVVCGVVVAILPMVRASRTERGQLLLRANSEPVGRPTANRLLIIAEIALCSVVLSGAGLFVRTLHNLLSQNVGFNARNLVVADLSVTRPQPVESLEEICRRLIASPGVIASGFSHIGQMSGYGIDGSVYIKGATGSPYTAFEQRISVGFLAAMGTPLVSGRDFSSKDRVGSPNVAIVNEEFVRRSGLQNPIGQRFGNYPAPELQNVEIVGVVHDAKWIDFRETPQPMYYRPFRQIPSAGATVVARFSPDAGISLESVRRATDLGTGVSLRKISALEAVVRDSLATERFLAYVSSALGLVALAIVGIGLYGLLTWTVNSRRKEIGLRLALGADPRLVNWMITRESLALLAVGLPLGLAATSIASVALKSVLFELSPTDPVTLSISLMFVILVVIAATIVPARRATRIDPLSTLRSE